MLFPELGTRHNCCDNPLKWPKTITACHSSTTLQYFDLQEGATILCILACYRRLNIHYKNTHLIAIQFVSLISWLLLYCTYYFYLQNFYLFYLYRLLVSKIKNINWILHQSFHTIVCTLGDYTTVQYILILWLHNFLNNFRSGWSPLLLAATNGHLGINRHSFCIQSFHMFKVNWNLMKL